MNNHCNAGIATTNLIGDMVGLGGAKVWYHPQRIANILSLARIKVNHWVTYNNSLDNIFNVHKPDGNIQEFRQSKEGVYHLDVKAGVTLVNTVAENDLLYSQQDYKQDLEAG